MMRKAFYFIVSLLLVQTSSGQAKIKIKGCIRNLPYAKVYLAALEGGKNTLLDSTYSANGCFDFYLPDAAASGMYSIILNPENNSFVRLLVNNQEDIVFSTVFNKLLDSMKFSSSQENEVYYRFLKANALANEKRMLIRRLITLSPGNASLEKRLTAELSAIDAQAESLPAELTGRYKNTLAAAFIKGLTPVKVPRGADSVGYLMDHMLDNVDFSNPVLHRSDMLASAILNYLRFSEQPRNTFTEQAEAYARVMDKVLTACGPNRPTYNYYRKELERRFMYGNYDIIGNYLARYYKDSLEQLPQGPAAIRERLGRLSVVCIGKQAPELEMKSYDGSSLRLKDIQSEYTLLVFWSSFCSHCVETLPFLKKMYDIQRGRRLEVVAISFDTDKEAWQGFIRDGNYGWINYSDLKGWDSPIVATFNIKGTPTYILLDRNKQVINKPATFEELSHSLENLKIF